MKKSKDVRAAHTDPSFNLIARGPWGHLGKFPSSGRQDQMRQEEVLSQPAPSGTTGPHFWGIPTSGASRCPPLPEEQTLGSSIHAAPSVIMSPAFRQSQLCFLPLEAKGPQRPKTPLPFLSLQDSLHGCENNLILEESTTSLNLKLLF